MPPSFRPYRRDVSGSLANRESLAHLLQDGLGCLPASTPIWTPLPQTEAFDTGSFQQECTRLPPHPACRSLHPFVWSSRIPGCISAAYQKVNNNNLIPFLSPFTSSSLKGLRPGRS